MLEQLNTIEDLNSILMLDEHYHDNYKINLGLLPNTDFSDYYYDFNVINMNMEESNYTKYCKNSSSNTTGKNDMFVSNEIINNDVNSFIQFDIKVKNINKSLIGIYYEDMDFENFFRMSTLGLTFKEWATITIAKIDDDVTISVNGNYISMINNLDTTKNYRLAFVLGNSNEEICIKNLEIIKFEQGTIIKEGIKRNSNGNITDCSASYGTVQSECVTVNNRDVKHINGNGYFTIGENGINVYDGKIYLYKIKLNTSAGTTDLSKVKLSIFEADRIDRIEGYGYKEWLFSDLFDNMPSDIYVILYNNKIYIFDGYKIKLIDDLPTVDKIVRMFFEVQDTSLWIESFNVYSQGNVSNIVTPFSKYVSNSSNILVKTKNTNHYIIEVYNKLWTGEIKFERLQGYVDRPFYWIDTDELNYNNELYIIHILYDCDDFDVILTLDNDYVGERKIYDTRPTISEPVKVKLQNLKINSEINKEYEYYYHDRPSIELNCYDAIGVPINDVQCDIFNQNYLSNDDGKITFTPPLLEPGIHYYNINMSKLGYESTYCKLKLIILKEECDIVLEEDKAYWGGFCTDTIRIKLTGGNQEDVKIKIECEDSNINKSIIKKLTYNTTTNDYYTTYKQSYRKKRLQQSSIKVTFEGNEYIKPTTKTFIKKHERKIVNSWTELKNEINNNEGVDIVGLSVGHHKVNEMITIRRDFEIQGVLANNDWATIENTGDRNTTPKYAFNIFPEGNEWITVNINSLKFWELNKCMFLNGLVNVNIDNCLFLGNSEGYRQDLGICVETNIGQTYINNNYGNLNVTRTTFINNKGSCIATSYATNIDHCKFVVDNWNYAQHPQAYGVEVYGQKTQLKNSDFILSMTGNSPLPNYQHSNFSHGSVPIRIGKQAYLNNVNGNSYARDGVGGLCSNGCTAYSYAKYKYDGINVTLSPTIGHERCAYKHIVNGINWAYKDNVQVNSYYDNRNKRPNIEIPISAIRNLELNKYNQRIIW